MADSCLKLVFINKDIIPAILTKNPFKLITSRLRDNIEC